MRRKLAVSALLIVFVAAAWAQRRSMGGFPFVEDGPVAMPTDANEKTEWAFARLQYPN